MKRTPGFKTRPNTYTIGLAPTGRAKCRACKQGVEKGEVRIVTHAFVKPGRSHDFVCHLKCSTPALVEAMLAVYLTVDRVPMAVNADVCKEVCTQLERNRA
jgi:hypothetical protein